MGLSGLYRAACIAVSAVVAAATLAACSGAGGGGSDSINVLMVNNPQMEDLQKLTADNFTKQTGIKVNFTVLPENDVRDKITQEFSSQADQYDVASISNFEVPFYAKNGWLAPMDNYISKDPGFDQNDILQPMRQSLTGGDGHIYGEPFYGESSMLMYRKDVFQAKGLTVPPNPTWQQVADLAAQADGAQPGMKGICLRGQPGWGEVFAPLTTVVNTFGGAWFTKDWQPQVNAPEFKQATQFYVDLVRAHGEPGAAQAGFSECLNDMTQGKTAMWYDATSGAGQLEAQGSPVAGKIGYASAPVDKTQKSQWLYTWAWGIQKASKKQDAAWKFIGWASSKDYENLVGSKLGWSKVPDGKRASTYQNPGYLSATENYAPKVEQAISGADPTNPGVQPRPTIGIQFVDIPEFTDLGTQVSQGVSDAIAGRSTVDAALDSGQTLAEKVAAKYRSK